MFGMTARAASGKNPQARWRSSVKRLTPTTVIDEPRQALARHGEDAARQAWARAQPAVAKARAARAHGAVFVQVVDDRDGAPVRLAPHELRQPGEHMGVDDVRLLPLEDLAEGRRHQRVRAVERMPGEPYGRRALRAVEGEVEVAVRQRVDAHALVLVKRELAPAVVHDERDRMAAAGERVREVEHGGLGAALDRRRVPGIGEKNAHRA